MNPMDTYVIEINDSSLTLSGQDAFLISSPGYANLANENNILLGQEAEDRAYLEPLHTSNQFWHKLSQYRLSDSINSSKTPADVIWLHLLELWSKAQLSKGDVIFSVSGSLNEQQLSLLLGVAEQCPFQARAVVDTAVASIAGLAQIHPPVPLPQNATYFHIDIHLYKTVLTQLAAQNGNWIRTEVTSFPIGIVALKNSLMQLVADQFVQETRFDPLHEAHIEQLLYDSLPGWLADLKSNADIPVQLNRRSLMLAGSKVKRQLTRIFQDVTATLRQKLDAESTLLVSHRLAPYPGLLSEFNLHWLPENAVNLGIESSIDVIQAHDSGIPLVLYLPIAPDTLTSSSNQDGEQLTAADRPEQLKATDKPTHLLINNRAFKITDPVSLWLSKKGFVLSDANKSTPRKKVAELTFLADNLILQNPAQELLVNGKRPEKLPKALSAGDILMLKSHSLSCIQVMD